MTDKPKKKVESKKDEEDDGTLPEKTDLPPHTSMDDLFKRVAKNYDEKDDPELNPYPDGGQVYWPVAEYEAEIKAAMEHALDNQEDDTPLQEPNSDEDAKAADAHAIVAQMAKEKK